LWVVAIDVSLVLAELLSRNRGPDPLNPEVRLRPDYRVAATLEGSTLDMVLTFREGAAYCCMEWGCHMAMTNGRRWDRLREVLDAKGVAVPPRLDLRLEVVIEEGALFFDLFRPDPSRRGWYAFKKVAACRYQESAVEADDGTNRR
jgi:hypothetical protein